MPASRLHPWPNGGSNGEQPGRSASRWSLLLLVAISLSACAMSQPPAPGAAHPATHHPAPAAAPVDPAEAWSKHELRGIRLTDQLAFESIIAELAEARVVYLAETHDRYGDHLLQLRAIKALHQQNPKLAIAMEMFARPRQPVLDAYLAGKLDEAEFLKQSGWFRNWGFDYRLYRGIIDFAREQKLPLIALNLEKGVTGKVFRKGGVAALNAEERQQLPLDPDRELDLTLPGYRERLEKVFSQHQGEEQAAGEFEHFLQAQALWDETMAATAADFLRTNPDYRLAVVVGQGHTDKRNAIPPRLARRLAARQAVIAADQGTSADPAAADYLIFTPPAALPDPALLGVIVGEHPAGVEVSGLSPHGPARQAGVREKDVITALDGQPVASPEELRILLFYRKPGESAKLTVRRPTEDNDYENVTIKVTF